MAHVLVTGATGFVGSALAARLAQDGHLVRAAVRASGRFAGEEAVVGDIGPETDWFQALEGIEIVVHLAGLAHAGARDRGAAEALHRVNALGVKRLAEQAEQAGVRRLVLVSSVKAAADISTEDLIESQNPEPETPYGLSKLEGERALRAAAKTMEPVILRPPLVYGEGVGANFLALLRLIDSGRPLPFGAVYNRRSLIARANLVDALAAALTAPEVAGRVYYVADGMPISTPSLIRNLATALGKPTRLISVPPPLLWSGAVLIGRRETARSLLGSLAVNDSAFRRAAGWSPSVGPADAFRAVAAWYRARKEAG